MSKLSPAVERVAAAIGGSAGADLHLRAEKVIRALADVTEAEADRMADNWTHGIANGNGRVTRTRDEILSLLEPFDEPTPVDPAIAVVKELVGYRWDSDAENLLAAIDKARGGAKWDMKSGETLDKAREVKP